MVAWSCQKFTVHAEVYYFHDMAFSSCPLLLHSESFKAKIFTLGEWYRCRGLILVANSGYQLWGLSDTHTNPLGR